MKVPEPQPRMVKNMEVGKEGFLLVDFWSKNKNHTRQQGTKYSVNLMHILQSLRYYMQELKLIFQTLEMVFRFIINQVFFLFFDCKSSHIYFNAEKWVQFGRVPANLEALELIDYWYKLERSSYVHCTSSLWNVQSISSYKKKWKEQSLCQHLPMRGSTRKDKIHVVIC